MYAGGDQGGARGQGSGACGVRGQGRRTHLPQRKRRDAGRAELGDRHGGASSRD